LAAAGCFVFLYQQRATGNGLLSPYQLNRSTYGIEPIPFFIWQSLLPAPTYHHSVMKRFYLEWEAVLFLRAKSWRGFAEISLYKLRMTWLFFLGPPLTIALLMLPNSVRDRRVRPLFWVALVFTLGMAVQPWFSVHYAGAITGLLFVIVMQSARHLRQWRRGGKPVGQFLVRAIPLICVVSVGVRILVRPDLRE